MRGHFPNFKKPRHTFPEGLKLRRRPLLLGCHRVVPPVAPVVPSVFCLGGRGGGGAALAAIDTAADGFSKDCLFVCSCLIMCLISSGFKRIQSLLGICWTWSERILNSGYSLIADNIFHVVKNVGTRIVSPVSSARWFNSSTSLTWLSSLEKYEKISSFLFGLDKKYFSTREPYSCQFSVCKKSRTILNRW